MVASWLTHSHKWPKVYKIDQNLINLIRLENFVTQLTPKSNPVAYISAFLLDSKYNPLPKLNAIRKKKIEKEENKKIIIFNFGHR